MNGSLLRRLVLVEERAPRPPAPMVEENLQLVSFWERVRAVAPPAVWTYFGQIDLECQVALEHGAQPGWLEQHHPAFDDVLEGLARAIQNPGSEVPNNRLRYTQGWVIQWATARLGMAYATERPGAGVTTSTVIDRVVQERAAHDLLGWTIAESYRQWSDPCAFLEQWRSLIRGFPTADMLGKAGLHAAELALLDAEGER